MGEGRQDEQLQFSIMRDTPAAVGSAMAVSSRRPNSPSLGQWRDKVYRHIERLDFAPDLGADIGSKRWFRGLGTFVGLSVVALAFWPDFAPLEAASPLPDDADVRSEYRSQMVMPLGLGADTGRRMGPTALLRPLAEAPERPQMQMLATLGRGDSLERTLLRAGIGGDEVDMTNFDDLDDDLPF